MSFDTRQVSGDVHLPPSTSNNVRGSGSSLSHAKSFPSTEGQQTTANLRHAVTAENLNPAKAIGESAKTPNAEIDFQWVETKEAASQGYMNLFSPVKKKPKKPVSLVASKSTGQDKVSDPRLRTSEKEDQRSVISAPLLWNETATKYTREKTNGEEHEQANKSLAHSREDTIAFSAGQKTPAQSIPLSLGRSVRSSDSDSASLLAPHRIPSVAPDIGACDKINDGKLLSQIRSIRAKVEGDKAARGNLSIYAPYMSNKVKTSAMVRSGGVTEPHKVSSLPQEKIIDTRLQVLDRNRVEERVDGSRDEADKRTREEPKPEEASEGVDDGEDEEGGEAQLPSREETAESDASFGEDIWLVEEKPTKSRKRKNFLPFDDLPSSSTNSGVGDRSSSRTASRAGSSKSRKTVSWDDGLNSHNNADHSTFLVHGMEPPSSPQFGTSSEHPWPPLNFTGIRTGISLFPNATSLANSPIKKLNNASNRYPSGASSLDEHSFYTPKEVISNETGGMSGLDPLLGNALMEMQMMFKSEMKNMQAEMGREFQAQRNILEDLKGEMQMVREENGKLRNQLFELSDKRHQ